MPKIDLSALPTRKGSGYPSPHDEPCRERARRALGNAAGLTQFGVNLLHLPPGAWSSQRHWHTEEDEFVWILDGEVTLVTDAGEEILRTGECAGFKANDGNGHHLQNRSDRPATILEMGSRRPETDAVVYPDIDLRLSDRSVGYTRKDGSPP